MGEHEDLLRRLGLEGTLEEMQARFKEIDQTGTSFVDMDYDGLDQETVKLLETIKAQVRDKWEPLAMEMGRKSPADYYSQDDPLNVLEKKMEDLAAGGVATMIVERPEMIEQIIEAALRQDDPQAWADRILSDAVEATMLVMNFPALAKVIQEIPAEEDFSNKPNNHRAMDFNRKWHHSRAKTQTVSLEQHLEDGAADIADFSVDVEAQAISEIRVQEFWHMLNDDDQALLRLKMLGLTQEEIARKLGYKTHSAVSKRLQKLRRKFDKMN